MDDTFRTPHSALRILQGVNPPVVGFT